MRLKITLVVIALAIAGALAGGLAAYQSAYVSAGGGEEIGDVSQVMDWQEHGNVTVMDPQERGTSTLIRNAEGITMKLHTTDLAVGAHSIWWVIFNNPNECTNNECGLSDTGAGGAPNPAEASVMWATGGIVGPDREGHFSASLKVGLDKAPGEVLLGPGLLNPLTAEVHMVVRFHGYPEWDDAERFLAQQSLFLGNCDKYPCYMPQASVHLP